MTDEQLGQMKLIFNYNDVFYSFFYDDLSGCVHRSREYAINYVYSGGMDKLFVRWDKAHGKWDNPPHGGMKKYGHYNMASSWE